MATKRESNRERDDLRILMDRPEFRRFCFRIVETSGIATSAYGAEVAVLFQEGRRSLGLDILRWISDASPLPEQSGFPLNALLPLLTEEANSRLTSEVTNAPRSNERYDRNSDLDDERVE